MTDRDKQRGGGVLSAGLLIAAIGIALAAGQAGAEQRNLRVCSSPDNLPFSNDREEGFENRIADLIAEEMGAKLTYVWHPQRRGFIRRTLTAGACDVVLGVPSGYDPVLTTEPYYASSYVFVTAKNRRPAIISFDDPALRHLRIGLHAIGDDGANPPPAHALARRGLVENIHGYRMWDVDTVDNPQAAILDAVAAGEIDVAIVWGPLAGYFARTHAGALEIMPVSPAFDPPSLPFVYRIAMGVRHGEEELKRELEEIVARRRADIDGILAEYGVPLITASTDAPPP